MTIKNIFLIYNSFQYVTLILKHLKLVNNSDKKYYQVVCIINNLYLGKSLKLDINKKWSIFNKVYINPITRWMSTKQKYYCNDKLNQH